MSAIVLFYSYLSDRSDGYGYRTFPDQPFHCGLSNEHQLGWVISSGSLSGTVFSVVSELQFPEWTRVRDMDAGGSHSPGGPAAVVSQVRGLRWKAEDQRPAGRTPPHRGQKTGM